MMTTSNDASIAAALDKLTTNQVIDVWIIFEHIAALEPFTMTETMAASWQAFELAGGAAALDKLIPCSN